VVKYKYSDVTKEGKPYERESRDWVNNYRRGVGSRFNRERIARSKRAYTGIEPIALSGVALADL
jgi:hypothetical protein